MANCTVTYVAKRRLRNGVTAGDIITLPLRVTQFERDIQSRGSSVTTLSGREVTKLHALYEQYNVATGVVAPELQPIMDEFGFSVLAGETFTITHPDEGDREVEVTLVGKVRRSRAASIPLNQFRHSFTVREIVE